MANPKPRVSTEQWERLLAFMERYPDLGKGAQTNDGPHAKQAANQLWLELVSGLNSMGSGCHKSVSEWKVYWKRYRCEVRKKASERRTQASATGGGPLPRGLHLTEKEERILSIIGKKSVYGLEDVRIPFPREEDSPPPPPPQAVPVPAPSLESAPGLATPVPPSAATPQPRSPVTPLPMSPITPPQQSSPVISTPGSTSQVTPRSGQQRDRIQVVRTPPQRSGFPMRNGTSRAHRNQAVRTPRVVFPIHNGTGRAYRRVTVPAPDWALDLEERRLRIEEKRLRNESRMVRLKEQQIRLAEELNGLIKVVINKMDRYIDYST